MLQCTDDKSRNAQLSINTYILYKIYDKIQSMQLC
jgi:hypothetical protein